jgi:Protein of unknown function (DUF3618)
MTVPEMEIQQEIERTREHLGDTVEELAARADVRTRARAKAAEMKDRAAGAAAQLRERGLPLTSSGRHAQRRWPVAAAAAGAVVIGSVLIRRRRRKA